MKYYCKRFTFLSLALFGFFLTSCNKDASLGGKPPAVFDSSETAKPVTITEKEHRIYFRPKVGDVNRYLISQRSNSSATSSDVPSGSESAKTEDIYYVRQTVRSIRADSSVDMSFRFDSVIIKLEKDTLKINLSSNREADRKDPRFSSYAALLGVDIGVIVSRFCDIKEIYGTSEIIATVMKRFPDSMRTANNINSVKQQVESTIAEYIHETLMHYPDNLQAKDSTLTANLQQNIPVWANVIYPMQISIKQVLTGFEERSGKTLAVYQTTTNYHPIQTIIENGPIKSSLNNYLASTKEDIRVEDATGLLVYRTETDENSFQLVLESKEQPGKPLTTDRKSKSVRTIELLR
jgi:hypothetical protein